MTTDHEGKMMDTKALIQAGNALAFTAQITGGIAGRDYDLVAAIEAWAKARDAAQADAQPEPVAGNIPLYNPHPCSCGKRAFCPAPWEPNCGLGKSDEHVQVASAPAANGAPDVARLWALEQAYRRSPGSYVADMCDELAAALTEMGTKP